MQETLEAGVAALQGTGADVYAYGIGTDLVAADGSLHPELRLIASAPDADHVHQIESFSGLSNQEFIDSVLLLVGCSPRLLSFGCNAGAGTLSLRFSRSVDPASYKTATMTLQSTLNGTGGQKRTIVGLTSADALSSNITVSLSTQDAEVRGPTCWRAGWRLSCAVTCHIRL